MLPAEPLQIPKVSSTGSFGGNHARTYRVFRRTHLTEQGALVWSHHAAQHITAATTLRFLRRLNGGLEALECIELGKFGANGIAEPGITPKPRHVASTVWNTSLMAATAT